VELTDTAGLRKSDCELETAGIALAQAAAAKADAVVLVGDGTLGWSAELVALRANFPTAIVARNKADLWQANGDQAEPRSAKFEQHTWPVESCAVSANTGEGISKLVENVLSSLLPSQLRWGEPLVYCEELAEELARLGELCRGDWSGLPVVWRRLVELLRG
jgi:tRNA U34 5-carboxymethylaminomethyl modifying GTPase MnmE/TrmE